jgi:hypothetical protein
MKRSILFVLLLLNAFVLADPATTKPVTVDLSTPKSALKTFVDGVKQGDVNGAKQALTATDPQDKKLINVGVAWESEVERLVEAVEKKFGEGAATTVRDKLCESGPAKFVPAVEKEMETAAFDVNGDSLNLTLGQDQPELKLVRENAQWKIDVAASMGEVDAQRKSQMIAGMRGGTKKLKAAREAVEAGKVESADEVITKIASPPAR